MIDYNIKSYPSYKSSGVEWLGDVPVHWEVRRLKFSMTLLMGQSPSSNDCSDERIGLPFLQGCAEFGAHHPNPVQFCRAPSKISPIGAILMSVRAPVGKLNIADQEYGIGRGLCAIIPNERTSHTGFSHYQLEALGHGLNLVATGSTYDAVSVGDIGNQLLVFPPLPEQTAIVRYLDHVDERIRRYISGKQKLIRLLEEEKQAVIHRAVTRGLDPNVRLKPSGVEWLGYVPVHWEVMPLRRLAISRCDGPFGSGLKSSHYTDQGIRVVRLQNIGHAQFNNSDSAFIAPSHYATLGDHTVEPEDLLIAGLGDERHPAGRACVAPSFIVPAMVKADCFRFRLFHQRVNPEFAALQLTATAGDASSLLSTGATRQRTNLQATAARPIAVPPIEEQSSIVRYLDKTTTDIDTAISRTRRQIELLQEYRTRLIADVVTGKIDVHEAAVGLPEEVNAPEPPETVGEPHRRACV